MENVVFDSKIQAVTGIFKGFLEIKEHQDIGNEILNSATANRAGKLIIDTSELKVIRQETQKWIEENWFPRAVKAGIKKMAFVIPKDALGKMSTQNVNQKSGPIEIKYFDNTVIAKAWLSSK
jgi:hypothetical protein